MKRQHIYAAMVLVSLQLVGVQPASAQRSIPDATIGTWDEVNRIFTLTTDVAGEGIEITQPGLSLDGNGHTVSPSALRTGTGVRVLAPDVSIQSLTVRDFSVAIHLGADSFACEILHNNFIGNVTDIQADALSVPPPMFGPPPPLGGNYWDKWTSPDDDGNGIVDLPYRLADAPGWEDRFACAQPDGWLTASAPSQWIAVANTAAGAKEATAAAITAGATDGVLIDATIAAWGYNGSGQCNVPAGTDFAAIAAGMYHSLALKTNGSLVAWGQNNEGQCDVPAGADFAAIAAGRW